MENEKFRLLFSTLPTNDLGLLTRSVPIAEALAARGHEIVFTSPGGAPTKLLSQAGFGNIKPKHPMYEVPSDLRNIRGLLGLLGNRKLMSGYGGRFRFLTNLVKAIPRRFAPPVSRIWSMDHMAAISGLMSVNFLRANFEAYLALVTEVSPDAIVDFWNPFICIVARKLKIPLVTVIQADAHPGNRGFIWWEETPDELPTILPGINGILRESGLREIIKLEELNVGDLTLVVGSPESDPLPENAEATHIGPVLWQMEGENEPGWFDELNQDKRLIWIYPGNPRYSRSKTLWDSEVILEACSKVLGEMDVQVVLSSGYQDIPEEYLPLPPNFILKEYVPGLKMASRCDLMIHHGGYGSCQTGLFTGTPALIIPTFSERESNARRVSEAGAGEYLLPETDGSGNKRIDTATLKSMIEHMLADESYLRKAKLCKMYLERSGNVTNTAKIIENFISSQSR